MSLATDLLFWLRTLEADIGVPPGNIDYAPVPRKQIPDEVAIGVAVDTPITQTAFGGGKMYDEVGVTLFISGKVVSEVELIAQQVADLFNGYGGVLPFTAPDNYGDKVKILSSTLNDSVSDRDEAQAVASYRLDFDVLAA